MDTKRQILVGIGIFGVFLVLWFGIRALLPSAGSEVAQGTSVFLYYYDEKRDTDSRGTVRCSSRGLVPVTRKVYGKDVLTETVQLLLEGELTEEDTALGVKANFPLTRFSLLSSTLDSKGVLTLTFDDPRKSSSGGSCRVSILRAQIEATARQFDGVIQVNLKPDDVLQP